MADPQDLIEEYGEDDEPVCSQGDLLDFQQAVLELAGDFAHLPIIGIVGALHTAAHVLTSTAFDLEDEELGEDEEPEGPLAISYATDED